MELPTKVNILGKDYDITYVDKPSEVDLHQRKSLWGQIDYWTRSIRVYNNLKPEDVAETIIHEVLHGIGCGLNMEKLYGSTTVDADEDFVSLLAMALADTFIRNGWIVWD